MTIAIGANDAALGLVEPSEYGWMYKTCLDIARRRQPTKPIVCISPVVCTLEESETGVPVAALTSGTRQVIRDVVERIEHPNISYVDGLDLLDDETALVDHIHPGVAGHALMASRLAPRLASRFQGGSLC